ncbi:MAG: retroviral-like aspartic protease family protein, partial [Patescibacteria group bacterium]
MTQVRLIIKNPRDPKRQEVGEFLVDSGAHYTVLPLEMVRKLKLKPSYEQDFSLADGKIISRSIGGAVIRFEDRELPVPVVLGEKNDTGLLGVTTLESF